MKKLKLLPLFVFCLSLCLSSVTSRAEEVESNYTFSDFCRYWSNGYKNHHIYSAGYLLGNKEEWEAVNTDLDIVTGRFLVIGEEKDEESSSISYALKKDWDFYRNIVYMGDNIPEKISFEYVMEGDLTKQKISEYDLIIIEVIAEGEPLSESTFITLDQLVKEGKYVVFDRELNSECVYTEETDGSVAVIDSKNDCLLISSNKKPGCFVNLHTHGSSGNTVTLGSIADIDNMSSWASREAVKSVKILPTYNSNIITKTFYTWYDAEEVILPACIDTISDSCFKKYSSLEFVNLDHIKVIGDSAFQSCNFSEVTIPDSVSTIGSFAFTSDSALDILSIHVNENGVSLGKNSFCVNSNTELRISYDGEESGKLQLFSPFKDNNIEVTADNFADFIKSGFILSFAGMDEDSEGDEEYVVTLVDNKDPVKTYSKQVKNGVPWEKYLEKLSNQEYSNVKLVFKGWIYEDGTIIDEKDIVNLDRNITIYSLYIRENETQTYTVNFPEYNKTIEIHYGDVLDQYDIPDPWQEDDIFLGWTQRRPINDDETENILTDHSRWWITSNKTIDLYGVWGSDLDKLTTTETLTMIPNYYLNRNNTGHIYFYSNGKKVTDQKLDQTSFSKVDETNSQALMEKIVKASDVASKICIVPNNYELDVVNVQKEGYYVITSGLENQELMRALTLMNCKYFQYLLVIQTPYVEEEEAINNCTGIGYRMKVTDWEIKDAANFNGWVYSIDTSIFMKYYNICNRVNTLVDNLVKNVFKFDTQTTITDALKAINNYVIDFTAYDNPKKIYGLKWFLEETSKSRNLQKEASHHGVCASYSKLAYAVLGRCGYETLPCMVWESNISYTEYIKGNEAKGPVHSINKVVIGRKDYYCDFTWAESSDPMRYMFLTLEEVNTIRSHYNPVPDDYGIIIDFSETHSVVGGENPTKNVDEIIITFDSNGGVPQKRERIQKRGQTIEKLPTVSKKGYIFKGWYTKKSGGKKITASTKITSNIILYAHWSKVTVKKAVIKSVKSQKKKTITIKYKKISGAEGYQIQYSTSRKFAKQKTNSITVKGNKSFTKNLTKLKKKTYYIRVRAYKKDSTKAKVYGKWSTIMKIKSK